MSQMIEIFDYRVMSPCTAIEDSISIWGKMQPLLSEDDDYPLNYLDYMDEMFTSTITDPIRHIVAGNFGG